ncbi:hypothetical protein SEA_YEET_28 [Mycobacterium phage Yeet]|uniref:Uncharacterized protein n=3 Tax=Omegavirus TaxID=1623292 RepID=A0A3S9UAP7_9CAUD|nr:hypothetical protein [Acinetobacter baumannii]YP_008410187.1 hypothetical protein N860_gp029 [Mycobacterium phage Redno2]YP_008410420.1 hypothetical protein N857_gp031 [Mycobacterium phage Wanda]YP_009123983.1 hypothetical protein VC71_gp030 [Mycobacterium phage Minerva]YP_009590884.1 hypothetical protein FDG54_gp028 [Mycobacterium phage Optimus]YP_009636198.1 hypothetical protein FGG20_gp027 [Mycobacterium phage Baka]ATN88838.1 hypothetical protein SEA_DMPSTRDIVER_29 [Mycobacterium phage 
MAKYRTVQAVTFVQNGKVVSIGPNRVVEIDDAQAEKLGAKVERARENDSMFPDGAPIIPAGFVPEAPAEEANQRLVSQLPKPEPKKAK